MQRRYQAPYLEQFLYASVNAFWLEELVKLSSCPSGIIGELLWLLILLVVGQSKQTLKMDWQLRHGGGDRLGSSPAPRQRGRQDPSRR